MLAVRDLNKAFHVANGLKIQALDSITLSAEAGDCVCLLGANGSGKTTLLKVLAGLILPDSGQALVAGHSVLAKTRQVQEFVGFSPASDRTFYGRLTGFDNLRFFAGLRGLGLRTLQNRLSDLERPLALGEALKTPYQKASSGMKQRLSLARALLHSPKLLLLDEPAQSLDPERAEEMRNFIRHEFLKGDRLVLWSTQQSDEAWRIATRILILAAGRIAANGTPEELLSEARASSPHEAYMFWSKRNLS